MSINMTLLFNHLEKAKEVSILSLHSLTYTLPPSTQVETLNKKPNQTRTGKLGFSKKKGVPHLSLVQAGLGVVTR